MYDPRHICLDQGGWQCLQTTIGVINMVSEHFIEAANSTSINAPYGTEAAVTHLNKYYD